jgi:hypothetical protein
MMCFVTASTFMNLLALPSFTVAATRHAHFVAPLLHYFLSCFPVAYEIPDVVLQETPNVHPVKKLNYIFNMNVRYSALPLRWIVFCVKHTTCICDHRLLKRQRSTIYRSVHTYVCLQLRSVDPEEMVDLPLVQSEVEDSSDEGEIELETEAEGLSSPATGSGSATTPVSRAKQVLQGEDGDGDSDGDAGEGGREGELDHRENADDVDPEEAVLSGDSDAEDKVIAIVLVVNCTVLTILRLFVSLACDDG